MNVAVLVPRRLNEWRDRLWEYALGALEAMGLGWSIITACDDGEGPFNRSAQINRAAGITDWDIAVILDADSIVPCRQLLQGVQMAERTGKLVLPHHEFHSIDKASTRRILAGEIPPEHGSVRWVNPGTKSSCLCVSRQIWDEVGGFDERFQGWGFEDAAFYAACQALAGIARVSGPVYHLWHPRSAEKNTESELYQANRKLGDRYKALRHDPEGMRELLAERAVLPAA